MEVVLFPDSRQTITAYYIRLCLHFQTNYLMYYSEEAVRLCSHQDVASSRIQNRSYLITDNQFVDNEEMELWSLKSEESNLRLCHCEATVENGYTSD